jgi:exopolysaccharide biosynthesis polyprenyl glycosylphosphotransferase
VRRKDSLDVIASLISVVADALAVFSGLMLATWIRFDSGWFPLRHAPPADYHVLYAIGSAVATLGFLFVFRSVGLFVRPQTGSFVNKIPRILKAIAVGIVLTMVLAFAVKNETFLSPASEARLDFSRLTIGLAYLTIAFCVLLERYVLYRIEWNVARHTRQTHAILILGTDSVSAHLRRTLKREAMLRARVAGFLSMGPEPFDEDIRPDEVLGTFDDLAGLLDRQPVDQIIVTRPDLPSQKVLELLLLCERHLVDFNMVPDLFRLLTASMDFQSLDDIPLLGVRSWPLDHFWNRLVKRAEDIVGAVAGLVFSAPLIAFSALAIKLDSRGPVFYHQERCGEKGRTFRLHKLRTMRHDAEAKTGPVFASPNDDRRTRVGAVLRRYNLDEYPQFWNVLIGEMSLVGPRPERPHFVEKFKGDISRYMWRHVSKPGLTGWAQVNGLRGDTSIEERIKYDLYYLENWSLAFDFKILLKTVFARENAY